ncbi:MULTISPECIES: RHE_PE00001 family protein [Rhizobium]|uniref:RHE_PE00001 family protein n=1 Tax=Rhizobium TaxID=379 RepID=UPI0007E992A9|nr:MULTISPECIES: RHE_PE00001 family protein [Rhizobium]ANK94417.1 HTH DNA-binding domain-containing protein [Rhizobium sp. N6212]ANL00467.1 HTH DNA-binding domain-containing protein [Rhizobium sp. N621]ANL06588.1 HTH DNA-binding domain-containing protein [Rhizobium esperanzae]ANL12759.1 HTH DNA-binding domain-containing protein [Rhizobium sp. N1341]ANL24745.1 HTH DNA-binding domain-containing protein [Rhizobium sp. N113]
MRYDIDGAMLQTLLPFLAAAEDAVARLDERVLRSPVGEGFAERSHFFDAAGALWVAGELVHVEDLVLHDAHMDSRAPSHELTIAHSVLRTRRRIWNGEPSWALGASGLATLTATMGEGEGTAQEAKGLTVVGADDEGDDEDAPLAAEMAEIDALLARSQKLIDIHTGKAPAETAAISPAKRNEDPLGLLGDEEWDEEQRLAEWRGLLPLADRLPPILGAVILFEAWDRIEPLRRQHWLGGLLVGSYLRARGKVASHLFSFYGGLKLVRHERRRARDRATRLQAFLEAMQLAAAAGLKEIDRLSLARTQMELRFRGRRSNSSLPELADFVLSRPMVSAAMIARHLRITPRGALNLVNEIGIREITGRGRYRAWGII